MDIKELLDVIRAEERQRCLLSLIECLPNRNGMAYTCLDGWVHRKSVALHIQDTSSQQERKQGT